MSALGRILETAVGLFVDDGSLAIVIVALLASLALLARTGLLSPLITTVVLVGGIVTLLLENVIRTARRNGR